MRGRESSGNEREREDSRPEATDQRRLKKRGPDDWGAILGEVYLAISTHLSGEGRGLHHHNEARDVGAEESKSSS